MPSRIPSRPSPSHRPMTFANGEGSSAEAGSPPVDACTITTSSEKTSRLARLVSIDTCMPTPYMRRSTTRTRLSMLASPVSQMLAPQIGKRCRRGDTTSVGRNWFRRYPHHRSVCDAPYARRPTGRSLAALDAHDHHCGVVLIDVAAGLHGSEERVGDNLGPLGDIFIY